MSVIEVSSEISYRVNSPTSFVFNVMPAQTQYQAIEHETISVNPATAYEIYEENSEKNRMLRVQAQPSYFTLVYRATVRLNPEFQQPPAVEESADYELPRQVLPYLNASRYCESDRLEGFALKEFGQLEPGFTRVIAICNWTYEHLDYVAGSTDTQTSACDVLIQRSGVCRDYAHLAIALCRALCTPARYVSGYALGLKSPDFHGFFEAFVGGRWYLFDATRMVPTHGLVRIGTGCDAGEASFASIIGDVVPERMAVSAKLLDPGKTPDPGVTAEAAVSTA